MPVRKRFGQHFLHDPGVIRRIVEDIDPQPGERLLEIGPGRGALTWPLLERTDTLEVIEIDRDLAAALRADARAARLRIHVADALDLDYRALRGGGPPLRIVGNLPYNIATPLLFRLLEQHDAVGDITVMLQREVVERMVATAGSRDYGRLSVMLAAHCEVEALFEVGPGAFQPPPKVWSAVVRLRPAAAPRFAYGSDACLRGVVTAAFSHRRKTLRNALKALLSETDITDCGIDAGLRPEMLAPEAFGRLAARYCQVRA